MSKYVEKVRKQNIILEILRNMTNFVEKLKIMCYS